MIDIKPFIAEKIKHLARTELSYNENITALPVIVITETENTAVILSEGTERLTRITLQLDIYAEEVAETETIADGVSNILTEAGFRRSFSQSLYSEEAMRKCMRFTCCIDRVHNRIVDSEEA